MGGLWGEWGTGETDGGEWGAGERGGHCIEERDVSRTDNEEKTEMERLYPRLYHYSPCHCDHHWHGGIEPVTALLSCETRLTYSAD